MGENLHLKRRTFLKGAVASAAAIGVGASAYSTSKWIQPESAKADTEEKVAYFCHQFHCLSGCNLKCTVRDGRIAKIEPNDACDPEDQRICLRGLTEVQHVYAKDRLQTPMKRVGERGEGKFVQISWDEAIKTICDNIKKTQEKYGEQAVFIRKSVEALVSQGVEWIGQLLRAESGGNWGIDRGSTNGLTPGLGYGKHCYTRSMKEWPQASTILMLGHNLCESGMTYAQYMFDAQEAGTHIIAVDPRYSVTCSKADEWFPIKPGTDPAFVLGLLAEIVKNKWYDTEFMKANTSFPFLVERESGKIFVDKSLPLEDKHLVTKETIYTPYVYDQDTNSKAHYNQEELNVELEGSWTIDGVEVATQFTLLKEWIDEHGYSADWAAEETGIKSQDIFNIAKRYACNGPAIIDFGLGGPDKFANADVFGHAMGIITALTGNYGKPGTGLGFFGGIEPMPYADIKPWELSEEFHFGDTGVAMYEFPDMGDNCPVHCALTFGDAFTLEAANANKFLDWVKTLDFFAIVDIYHSSVVDYADIVLPACTKFECAEDVYNFRQSMGYISLATKAIDPLFDSKNDLDIERLLAAEFGLDKYMPKSYREYAEHLLSNPSGNIKGLTVEKLLENQGIYKIPGKDELPDGQGDQVYDTPTKKFEVYYENLLHQRHEFPLYEKAIESYEDNPLKEKYPIAFMQGKSRFRIHAYYSASTWFQEFIGPCVNISPSDAESRGINHGDDVRVFNDRGSFIAQAIINNGIMDGTAFMFETTYNRYYKDGFLQNVTNDARNQRCYDMQHGPQILYNDTLVQIEKA